MRKKAKYSLIIGVVLIIILGLGFGVYKMFFAPRPLKIKDLENMHITTTRTSEEEGWGIYVAKADTLNHWHGEIFDCENRYMDSDSNGQYPDYDWYGAIVVGAYTEASEPDIQAGDTLEITYDSGKRLTIYLPVVTKDIHWLYVATDGSTYHDKWLTQPAQLVPSEEKR